MLRGARFLVGSAEQSGGFLLRRSSLPSVSARSTATRRISLWTASQGEAASLPAAATAAVAALKEELRLAADQPTPPALVCAFATDSGDALAREERQAALDVLRDAFPETSLVGAMAVAPEADERGVGWRSDDVPSEETPITAPAWRQGVVEGRILLDGDLEPSSYEVPSKTTKFTKKGATDAAAVAESVTGGAGERTTERQLARLSLLALGPAVHAHSGLHLAAAALGCAAAINTAVTRTVLATPIVLITLR